jgi:hypothetical protein
VLRGLGVARLIIGGTSTHWAVESRSATPRLSTTTSLW